MASGNSVKAQFGKETIYGQYPAAMSWQVKIANEGFTFAPEKKQEPVMTGGVAQGVYETMSISATGAMSFIARPDDLGFFLKLLLGAETVSGAGDNSYKHIFAPLRNAPIGSCSALLDKGIERFMYTGCKFNSLSFSAAPADYLSIEAEVFARDEIAPAPYAPTALLPSALKAFKFWQASVFFNGAPEQFSAITSVGFNYNNNLENVQTTDTGQYFIEPEQNMRALEMTFEMLFSQASEAFRKQWFKTDDIFSTVIEFTSDQFAENEVPYSLKITVPCCQVSDAPVSPASDEGLMRQSVTVQAIDNPAGDFCTFELVNTREAVY